MVRACAGRGFEASRHSRAAMAPGGRCAAVLMSGGGGLAFLVEQARQAANLELAVEEKIPARHDLVALAQSAQHRIGIIGARAGYNLDRRKLALALLDIHELAHAAVEHGGHGHGEEKLVAFRLRARGRAGNLHERHFANRALAGLRLQHQRVHWTTPLAFDAGGRGLAIRQKLRANHRADIHSGLQLAARCC